MVNETVEVEEQRELFEEWMRNIAKLAERTIRNYVVCMQLGYEKGKKYKTYSSVFEIRQIEQLSEYEEYLFNESWFKEFDVENGHRACSCGLKQYMKFLKECNDVKLD